MKLKTCRHCKTKFAPVRPLQRVCSPICALESTRTDKARVEKQLKLIERKADKVKREKLKSRSDWMKEAQAAFNGFIRARDVGRKCISCGRHHEGQIHAGHYLSVGAWPELRFNEMNVWAQCAPCNTYLSGNAVYYRKSLVREIGLKQVELLEGPHAPVKYTIDDLKAIKADYTAKARELKRGIA
jgi:hypothetical protein